MKKPTKTQISTLLVDLVYDIVGCFIYGVGMVTFASASNFAPGGVSGIAILLNYLTKIPIGFATVLLNIPIILLTFKTLGKKFFARSVKTIVVSWVVVDYLVPLIPNYTGEPILAAIFGGILAGAGLALIYIRDSSTGGSDFVIMAIRKKNPHLSLGNISLDVDSIIIVLGAVVYKNINAMLYGFIMTILYSLIIDKLMYGFDSRKMVMVITEKGKQVADRIGEDVERGVTIANGQGGYTGNDKQILLCTCSKAEVFKIRKIAYQIDPAAFIIVSSVDTAYGEGFKPIDE